MEGTACVDIEHQVVSELAEALADDVVTSVARLQGTEYERYLFTGRIGDGNPAIGLFEDGRPAGKCRPEFKETVIQSAIAVLEKLLRTLRKAETVIRWVF